MNETQDVRVTCNVPGAHVRATGQGNITTSPGILRLRRTDHAIVFTAPGYAPTTVLVEASLSAWRAPLFATANVLAGIGTFLFPLWIPMYIGIDLRFGAWNYLPDEVHAQLTPALEAHVTPPPVAPVTAAATPATPPAPASEPLDETPPPPPPMPKPAPAPTDTPKARFCTSCGDRLAEQLAFCPACGARQ